jgi:hypothetical protein
LDTKPLMKGLGFNYRENGQDKHEYHVDCHPQLYQYVDNANLPFGGNLSVRLPPGTRPAIIIGQDESVFSQHSYSNRVWSRKGQKPLRPKGLGESWMVSAFQSRSFGLGRTLTIEELAAINLARLGTTYKAEEAAREINGHINKRPLTDNSPFITYFDVGADRSGYWNHDHAALQTEDLVDCCLYLYPDHDLIFLFDHSSGHAKRRHGGTYISEMNWKWGEKRQRQCNRRHLPKTALASFAQARG